MEFLRGKSIGIREEEKNMKSTGLMERLENNNKKMDWPANSPEKNGEWGEE